MRLLTRSDFDGLICGMLLMEKGVIDSWKFVHPKDIQDGLVEVTSNDVLANIPYVEGCGMWFDHHSSEELRLGSLLEVPGDRRMTKSAARLIYDYYGGPASYPNYAEMLDMTDKVDSGELTLDEIMNPTGWILLGFLSDPRTGLGRFQHFRISNYQLMEELITHCRNKTIDDILALPDMQERIAVYNEQKPLFIDMVKQHTKVYGNVIVTDLRGVKPIYTSNRFMVYSLYPEQNVSMWVVDGRQGMNIPIAVGYSILNRTCTVNIGDLLLTYGGGGHKQVGTCQVSHEDADRVIRELIDALK